LLTLAQRPYGVAWITSQPWMRRSLPSYNTLRYRERGGDGERNREGEREIILVYNMCTFTHITHEYKQQTHSQTRQNNSTDEVN
jgi:hypothetical protein